MLTSLLNLLLFLSAPRLGESLVPARPACAPEDADVMDLAEMNIFQTSSYQNGRITEDIIKKQLSVRLPADTATFVRTQEDFQRSIEAGTSSIEYGEILTRSTTPDEAMERAYKAYQAYQPVCPYRYYVLAKYKWFFYFGGESPKYCWPFYNIYGTSCTHRFCNWSYQLSTLWSTNYRCFPEYRYIYMWARCLTLEGRSATWTSEFVRRAVPRGCSCRKLFWITAVAKQCPAAGSLE